MKSEDGKVWLEAADGKVQMVAVDGKMRVADFQPSTNFMRVSMASIYF